MDDMTPTNLAQGAILGGQMNPEAQAKWNAEQAAREAKYEAKDKAQMMLNKRAVALEAAIRLTTPDSAIAENIIKDAETYFAFLMKAE